MRETAERMWAQIREWFGKMPRVRKIQMAVLSVLVIVLAIIVVSLLTRTTWVNLPNTGDAVNTSHVFSALREMGLPHRAAPNASGRIQVPENRLHEIQMLLTNAGYLETSDFDGSILDGATGFGITDQHARLVSDRQLGSDIRRQLMTMDRIASALVIVASGETSAFRFSQNTRHAAASVMLTLRGGPLSRSEVQVIADLVRTSIPGIEYDNIHITDSQTNTYRIGDSSPDPETVNAQRELLERRLRYEFQESVLQLLVPVVGHQNIRVQPYVRLNYDKVAMEKVEYGPPIPGETEGMRRTGESIRELARTWTDAMGIPGTDSNNMGMGSIEYPYGTLDDELAFWRAVERNNFELNQIVTQIERQEYVIEALSIGITINSDIEGLADNFVEQVRSLVANTIYAPLGNISVQMFPYLFPDTSEADQQAFEDELARQARNRWLFETILSAAVILLLGIMVMMLVRTIVKAVKPPPEPEPLLMAAGPDGIDLLVDDDDEDDDGKEYMEVDLNQKSPGLEQIERFIDKDAASVAQLLRNWLSDE